MLMNKPTTFGAIVGNRSFFPDHLADEGRKEILSVLADAGYGAVALGPEDSAFGSVETRADAKKCAELFKRHAGEIDGIVVTLPNFGDERGVADALRLSGLDVPVLIQATPDDPKKMTLADRRDSFCGKMSVCNNLRQYGLDFSLTSDHTVAPSSVAFREDLDWFAATCRVVRGLRTPGWEPSAHARQPSTPCATARRSWRPTASAWRWWTCRRSWAASASWTTTLPR
jgi:L-fucose isomerase-like protein